MKHEITPAHHGLVEAFEKCLEEASCKLPVSYYAGYDTSLYTDDGADMNTIAVIHFYDSFTGIDGLDLFQQLEDTRQLLSRDDDFIRVVVLSLPETHRMDIDLQVTKIK